MLFVSAQRGNLTETGAFTLFSLLLSVVVIAICAYLAFLQANVFVIERILSCIQAGLIVLESIIGIATFALLSKGAVSEWGPLTYPSFFNVMFDRSLNNEINKGGFYLRRSSPIMYPWFISPKNDALWIRNLNRFLSHGFFAKPKKFHLL